MPSKKGELATLNYESHRQECSLAEEEEMACLNEGECYKMPITSKYSPLGCRCTDEYTGDRCETKSLDPYYWTSREFGSANTASLAGGLTVCFLLIIAVIIGFAIYLKRRSNVVVRRRERSLQRSDRYVRKSQIKANECSPANDICNTVTEEVISGHRTSQSYKCSNDNTTYSDNQIPVQSDKDTDCKRFTPQTPLSPRQCFFIDLYSDSGLLVTNTS